jgi:hypothetical protein
LLKKSVYSHREMANYHFSASVTSPPTNVSLVLNNQQIDLTRDGTGAWAAKGTLDLPNSFTLAFGAVGIASAPWTLEIKFTTLPPENKLVKDYKHEDKIPDNLLSIFHDTVVLA